MRCVVSCGHNFCCLGPAPFCFTPFVVICLPHARLGGVNVMDDAGKSKASRSSNFCAFKLAV